MHFFGSFITSFSCAFAFLYFQTFSILSKISTISTYKCNIQEKKGKIFLLDNGGSDLPRTGVCNKEYKCTEGKNFYICIDPLLCVCVCVRTRTCVQEIKIF